MFVQVVRVLSVLFFCNVSYGARILGYVPTPSYSHQVVFHPLWKELAARGHHVTVIQTDIINNSSIKNLKEINVHDVGYNKFNSLVAGKFEDPYLTTMLCLKLIFETLEQVVDVELNHPDVKALIADKNQQFDLVMIENMSPIPFAFAKRFDCPAILLQSFDPLNDVYSRIGNPTHPISNPDLILPCDDKLTFFQRLWSIANEIFMKFMLKNIYDSANSIIEKHFGKGYPTADDLFSNISAMFVNSDLAFYRLRAVYPNIIQIGGGTHLKAPAPLPKDLQKYLDDAKEGFIYFSLGSNIKSKDLPLKTLDNLLETFAELPYKVLWKFELDQLHKQPANVYTSKWFPQQDVLRHPNIKLFITQGGLQSIEESLHSHVPMIGVPFFADQPANVKRVVVKGLGLSVDHNSLDKEDFKSKILEVIENPKYKERITEIANLVVDQPMTGLERAVWWTEYVLRHKGAKHFRSPALDLPTYQYYLLDVIGFCLLVIVIIVYIIVKILKMFLRMLKSCFCKPKKEKRN